MEYTFAITLIAAVLSVQVSQAGVLPKTGILKSMPVDCLDLDYCTVKHSDYPQEEIDWLLTEKYGLAPADTEPPKERKGDNDLINPCIPDITYKPIYEITDEHDNVRVVVQSQMLNQTIRIERCLYPGRQTKHDKVDVFNQDDLNDFNITCVEKKLEHKFLVLSLNGTEMESVSSKHGIPTCCSCRVSYI